MMAIRVIAANTFREALRDRILYLFVGFALVLVLGTKIFGLLTESQPPVGSQLWIGGVIELVAGILVMVGFQTRWAAFIASGTMAVAYFQFHWKFRMGPEFFPAINGGDAAILYCFVFLYIACRGAGIWAFEKSS